MTIDILLNAFTLPFMQRAMVAGVVIGMAAAFLGVFITLRNLSFYSDTIAHSALAGIALGLLFHLSPTLSAIVFCILIGIITVAIKNRSVISLDTVVGVIFSAGLSLGVVLISLLPSYRSELFSILFGDILTLNWWDVAVAVGISLAVMIFLLYTSKQLLLMTFSPDFTFVRGINGTRLDYAFFIVTALTIAVSIKIVGIILVTGLLILPAAIAKNLAKSFKQLVVLAISISLISTVLGLSLSFVLDLPAGPTIILVSTVGFGLSLFGRVK
ncbi:MAG: high-affinity zinc uptake system, membrane protein [uncultured bacterium]|nr:MAG: high-affinity zinc uptake system, membrane protein [uncultured bacterium]